MRHKTPQPWVLDGDVARLTIRRRDGAEYVIEIDAADLPVVQQQTWWLDMGRNRTPYASATVYVSPYRKRNILMHRFLLGLDAGDRSVVDHEDGNGLNNRRSNVRRATQAQNRANERAPRTSASRYKGVVRASSGLGGWKAQGKVGGRFSNLGTFDREIDAALAYDDAARAEFGPFAATNFTAEFAEKFPRQPRRGARRTA